MSETVNLTINGKPLSIPAGTTVAAAMAIAGCLSMRNSVTGEPRGALCGMGICFECRVTLNGRRHLRSCQIECQTGMDVRTDG